MNTILRRIFPFLYGIVMFAAVRIITDIPKDESLWGDQRSTHIFSQLSSIISCYLFDLICRFYFKKKKKPAQDSLSILKEYGVVCICMFIFLNLHMYIWSHLGFVFLGNGLADYAIANVIYIPFFLIYYAIIRSDVTYKYQREQESQLEKVKTMQLETELKFLKAQYHPHFLFNALNTVYFQVHDENNTAKQTIELLSGLLRYQLYDKNQKVDISHEIEYLDSYIRFQRLRMSDRLVLKYYFDPLLSTQKIHPLLFQPLLENAFKHVGGEYRISIDLLLSDNKISLTVKNSVASVTVPNNRQRKGIGIENLKRRLEILYPGKFSLDITNLDNVFSVTLVIIPD